MGTMYYIHSISQIYGIFKLLQLSWFGWQSSQQFKLEIESRSEPKHQGLEVFQLGYLTQACYTPSSDEDVNFSKVKIWIQCFWPIFDSNIHSK